MSARTWQLIRLKPFFRSPFSCNISLCLSPGSTIQRQASQEWKILQIMIPRAPSLFHLEEGLGASTSTTPIMAASAAGELVGLRLIIQPSPRKQLPTVLRRSAVRIPAPTTSSCHENGRVFVGLEFLKICFCCHKNLDSTMDVFVYKGEQAFCSAECRCQHIAREERREIEALIRKRRDAFHRRHAAAAKMQGPNRLLTLQTTAAR